MRTVFETTYRMSTYSVGWSIVPDDFVAKSQTNIPGINTIV